MKSYFFFLFSLIISENLNAQVIRYVAPVASGSGNGTSWSNATANLQLAINSSVPGDEVWVRCGTYITTTTTNRAIAFSMRNGVTIYGGFAGSETSLPQRQLNCGSCSILSGDIPGSGNANNAYHVISNPAGLNNTSIIDGFVIQDANDNRSATILNGLGGGIYNNGGYAGNVCSPTIRNCIIRNNAAQFGAGIFNSGHSGGLSSPIIINCIITNNTAYSGGGGIDNFGLAGTASPTLYNCIVYANTATQRAGGMYNWAGNSGNASPNIIHCVFANNSASIAAGGMISDNENSPAGSFSGNSHPQVFNSIFWGNTAPAGPQFYILGGGTVTVFNSCFNLSNQTGIHILSGSSTNVYSSNPQFQNINNAIGADNCWLSSDDGLQLVCASTFMNSGLNTTAFSYTNDIKGNPRISQVIADLGPYEGGVGDGTHRVQLELWLQGLFDSPNNQMQAVLANNGLSTNTALSDSIRLSLVHNGTLVTEQMQQQVMTINGAVNFTFSTLPSSSYYLKLNHRNHIETWSATTFPLNTSECTMTQYYFKQNASLAYGSNQQPLSNGQYAMYTGDVNQDSSVDALDYILLDSDLVAGASGYYATDLNGDASVDALDYLLLDVNLIQGFGAITP